MTFAQRRALPRERDAVAFTPASAIRTIEPEDEPVGSGLTRLHLAGMLRVLVQADDHLAPALHIQLAEQVVDMRLRCRQADVQPTGNLLVTEPRRDQLGGLPLAPGERDCRGWRVAADAEALGDGDPVEQLGGHPARAELLATMNIHNEAHEIGQSGSVRDIADHTRLRPG